MTNSREHPFIPKLKELLAEREIDRREFLRTATLLGMSAAAAYTFVGKVTGTGTASRAAETPKAGGTLRVGMRVQDITDPATYDWTPKSNIARHFLEYVTITGADNITRPYLAESWQASDDLKTWTFKFRKGIKWSNGDDFTADHVAFNVERWLASETGSSIQGLMSSATVSKEDGTIDAAPGVVEVVDDHTLRLNLAKPDLAIPEAFYHYPACICHPDSVVDGKMDIRKRPIGTGPFQLDDFAIGERAKLVKTDSYWGGPESMEGGPYLDAITVIDLGDEQSAAIAALASKQVDLLYEVAVRNLETVRQTRGTQIFEVVTAQTAVARFQMDKGPGNDPKVRRAFQLCMDHTKLLELAYYGRGQVAEDHHVCQIHPEYMELAKLRQDYARARRLLAEAGYPEGITLTLDVNANEDWEVAMAQAMVAMAEPSGIKLKLNVMPGSQFWEIWDKTPFGLTGWTHRPLGIMVLNLAYRTGAVWNESHFSDPDFDAALDKAGAVLDPKERAMHVGTCEQILQDSGIITQPLWRSLITAGSERVKGFQLHPTNYHQFFRTWLT